MRISVDHVTHYTFSEPQARLVQLLRVTPQDSIDQTVVNWHVGVDCDVRLREARDGFGNRITMLYADGPLTGITLTVSGEVLTAGEAGVVRGAYEPLPSALYRRATERTAGDEAIGEFARAAAGGGSLLDQLHGVNLALCDRFAVQEVKRDDGRSAVEVFEGATASARDLAHLMIACAHVIGAPARYVSGYHAEGGHHPAAHAWAEVCIEGLGWVAFDPTQGICADANYVRVAVALDATGAAPVAGSRLGEGEEELEVDVQVEVMSADA
jgi:transglutaminase-like putative cysteine protease